jgi:hypothetical protein
MVDVIHPDEFATKQELKIKTVGGEDLLVCSGYALFGLKGSPDGGWNHKKLQFEIGPKWINAPQIVPVASLASVMNKGVANNAGWAVDDCDAFSTAPDTGVPDTHQKTQMHLSCRIAVRDSDGILYRVSYYATMLGTLWA